MNSGVEFFLILCAAVLVAGIIIGLVFLTQIPEVPYPGPTLTFKSHYENPTPHDFCWKCSRELVEHHDFPWDGCSMSCCIAGDVYGNCGVAANFNSCEIDAKSLCWGLPTAVLDYLQEYVETCEIECLFNEDKYYCGIPEELFDEWNLSAWRQECDGYCEDFGEVDKCVEWS